MTRPVDRPDTRGRPRGLPAAVVVGGVAAVVLVVVFAAGGNGPHGGLGLPDAGVLTTYGLPVTRAVTEIAAVATVGFLLLAAFLLPRDESGAPHEAARPAVRVATWTAAVWGVGALLMVPFTVAEVVGRDVQDVFTSLHLLDIAPNLPYVAAWGVAAVLAAAAAEIASRARSWGATVAACVVAVAALLPVAATGHSATGNDQDVAIDSLMVHVVSAALWVGGLVALLAFASRRTAGAVPGDVVVTAGRYSRLALVCWTATAISGVVNLATRAPISELLVSRYGQLAVAKAVALLVLGGLGYAHRRYSLRRLQTGDPRGLLRLGAVEVVVMLGTLGLAVALGRTAPPVTGDGEISRIADALGYDLSGPPTLGSLALGWRFDLLAVGVVVLAVGGYLLALRRLPDAGAPWPVRRTVAWLGGWAAVLLATCSGIARYAPAVFSALMMEQVLLAVVAPMLLVLGAPVTLLLRLRPAPGGAGLPAVALAVTRSWWWRWLTDPALAVAVYIVTTMALVVSGAFAALVPTHWGRHLLQLLFLGGGVVLFGALLGRRAGPALSPGARWVALMVVVVAHLGAGFLLADATTALGADFYAGLRLPWGPGPLDDQRYGGALVWWSGQLPLLALLLGVLVRWWRSTGPARPGAAGPDQPGPAQDVAAPGG